MTAWFRKNSHLTKERVNRGIRLKRVFDSSLKEIHISVAPANPRGWGGGVTRPSHAAPLDLLRCCTQNSDRPMAYDKGQHPPGRRRTHALWRPAPFAARGRALGPDSTSLRAQVLQSAGVNSRNSQRKPVLVGRPSHSELMEFIADHGMTFEEAAAAR